jgi:hypothetical protein
MTRIVIDDVTSIQDLIRALAVVHSVFADDPTKFDSAEECFSKSHPDACTCDTCLDDAGTREVPEIAAPMPYIPCPNRGTHLRLTDCWACWCDVHRGACLEVDVLASEAWDIAYAALMPPAARHRADLEPVTPEPGYAGRHQADVVPGVVISDDGAA